MKNEIWIKVKCDNYYKIINKIKDIICVYEIKETDKYLYLKIDNSDYEKLCKYIVSYKFEIAEKTGINKIINIISKNKLFVIMTIFGFILFYIFNNLCVEVEILHESEYIRNLLYNDLEEYGISPLSRKKTYEELTLIKEDILENHKDTIDWIEIEENGMKYTIRVEERIITDIISTDDYCNVYAKKSGIVTSIVVEKGVSLIKIGDYINEGDLLISGDILHNEELKDEICASGIVKVEKWYEASLSVPFDYFEENKTGLTRYNFLYEDKDNKEIIILKDRISEYTTEKTMLFDLFGYKLYLLKQHEITREYKKYSEQEAIEKAISLSYENIILKLDEKDSVIDQKVLKKTINNSTIDIDIFIITEEVIS